MSEQNFFMIVLLMISRESSDQSMSIFWSNIRSKPFGPSKSPDGPVKPRLASDAEYTARIPVIPGEKPFHCDTGSTWTQVREMLSTVAIEIACAICSDRKSVV